MFIINFFKLLFLIVFGYMIYRLVKFIFLVWRNSQNRRAGNNRESRKQNIKEGDFGIRDKKGVIELDKDQYKVE